MYKKGAPGATRTRNQLIRSQVLYPLSYGGERGNYTVKQRDFSRKILVEDELFFREDRVDQIHS